MRSFVLTLLAILVFGVADIFAQTTLKGNVKDADTGSPLSGVVVRVAGSNLVATTDANGDYMFEGLSSGKYVFEYILPGYQAFGLEYEVVENSKLPEVTMKRAQSDEGQSQSLGEVTISTDDLESESKDQAVSSLLQSSQDAFNSAASFSFSPARFQIRGYDSDYTLLYMNGVPVNDPESGFAGWSSWGGLNDVSRNRESSNGLAPSDFSFGGLGGATLIDSRASQQIKGTRISYAATNRTYNAPYCIKRVYFTGLF